MPSFEVWDRQPRETSRAYALFAQYRDAGPLERSYGKVAREFGRAIDTIKNLAQRHNWIARAEAWDMENERVKRAGQLKELDAMSRRQILAGQLFQSKAIKRIQAMTDDEVGLMSVYEVSRLMELGVRIERIGRGEPMEGPSVFQQNISQNVLAFSVGPEQPIIELLRRNPTRVGPVVALLDQLREHLPELIEGTSSVIADEPVEMDADLLEDVEDEAVEG